MFDYVSFHTVHLDAGNVLEGKTPACFEFFYLFPYLAVGCMGLLVCVFGFTGEL